jgi:hypothetical protein
MLVLRHGDSICLAIAIHVDDERLTPRLLRNGHG